MPDRPELTDYRPADDHDLLVMLLANVRQLNEGIRDIRGMAIETQKDLSALRLASDRHDSRIAALESKFIDRGLQLQGLVTNQDKLKDDTLGRINRLEDERIDPLEQRLDMMRNWVFGAVAIIGLLWIFLAPVYTRLITNWFGGP